MAQPDEAYAELIRAQTQLNYTLAELGTRPATTYALMTTDLPKSIEQLIAAFVDRAREVATKFKAAQFSVQVSGFPPSVSLSLTWTLA